MTSEQHDALSPDERKAQDQAQDTVQEDLSQTQQSEEALLRKELEAITGLCQRLQADFDNYRKRTAEERAQIVASATSSLVQHLLPVLDAFELSLSHAKTDDVQTLRQVVTGMGYIQQQLVSVLQHSGLEPMVSDGQKYDPYKHQALESVPASEDVPADHVAATRQKGYLLHGKVLRTAKVVVAKEEGELHGAKA